MGTGADLGKVSSDWWAAEVEVIFQVSQLLVDL